MTDDQVFPYSPGKYQPVFFETVVPVTIGPTGVTEDEDVLSVQVLVDAVFVPSPEQVVRYELCGLMTVPYGHITLVVLQVVNAVWDYFPSR